MGRIAPPPTPFAGWLRGQLDERGWGVRTLAKRMNAAQPEIARRALNRYLKGSLPTEANRAAIAFGLGIDTADVPAERGSSDDEDEESEPMSDLDILAALRPLARLLTGAGQR